MRPKKPEAEKMKKAITIFDKACWERLGRIATKYKTYRRLDKEPSFPALVGIMAMRYESLVDNAIAATQGTQEPSAAEEAQHAVVQ